MAYLSLYRKYRSQTFSALIGQRHVVRTLQNGITSGKVAHAYLFTGPRGTGKTSTARLLAKTLCCEKGPAAEPCNECETCISITNGSCMDVFEMDAASESGVDDIREAIVEAVDYKPTFAKYRVFIIDEVHDLSAKAFDALLKTVEEPPEHVILILATTEYSKVPPTIRSRCQKFEFHRATVEDTIRCLETAAAGEGIEVEPAALAAIGRMADGAYRDALTLLEQAIITADGPVTLAQIYDQLGLISDDLVDGLLFAMKDADVAKVVGTLEEVARMGRDPRAIVESVLFRLADLTRAAYGISEGEGKEATREASLHETATRLGRDRLLSLRSEIAEAHQALRDVTLPRIWLESELIRISTQRLSTPIPAERAKAPESGAPKAEKERPVAVPAVTPKEKPGPVVEAAAKAPEESKPIERAVVATGDPAVDAAQELWLTMLSAMPENVPIRHRLSKSSVTGIKGEELTVEIAEFQVEWMMDNPKRQAYIIEELKKATGKHYQVKYKASKRQASDTDSEAVKLPAEGQRLHDMAREVLGS